MSVVDIDSSWSKLYVGEEQIQEFLKLIDNPEIEIIGHNIYNFDLKVIEKLYNWKPHKLQKITDTFLLAQIVFPDIDHEDHKDSHGGGGKVFTAKEKGSHSLKAWGQRIKCYKGEYTLGFEIYNDEMGRYCIQDTYTTKALLKFLETKLPEKLCEGAITLEIENELAPILARLQTKGVLFDVHKAEELYTKLQADLINLKWQLQEVFKPKYVSLGEFTPKRDDKKRGYVAGATFTKIELQEFNPTSRQQISERLISELGWKPEEFTETGKAKMDEAIIENLPYPQLKPLKEYLQTKLLIGKIKTAKGSWLNKVQEDGRIHGGIMQNGAITGRCSHYSPNMNIPSEKKLYGKECRELFIVPEGKVMVGCDADALEMRVIAGYLNKLDGGKMVQSVLHGSKEDGTDPHTINMHAYGVDNRDLAKTLYYSDVYGSKNAKKGATLLDYGVDLSEYVPDFEKKVKEMINWINKKNEEDREKGKEVTERTEQYWRCWVAGKHLMELYGEQCPELNLLKEKIAKIFDKNGYIKALDGRKLYSRSKHGQLNTLCQSAGAIIMKKAMVIADNDLQAAGLIPGQDYEFILFIHDEFELEVTDDKIIVDKCKEILQNSIKKAGEFFNFPCEMKGNSKAGKNWAAVH